MGWMLAHHHGSLNLRTFVACAMAALTQQHYLDVFASDSADTLRRNLLSFAERLSFDRMSAVLVTDRPGEGHRVSEVNNVPAAYAERAISVEDGRRDPVLRRLKADGLPFLYDQATYVEAGASDLWEEQAAYGYKTGISVALHSGTGQHFYLGLDRAKRLPSSDLACTRLLADIHLLATYAQSAACKIFAPESAPNQPLPRLTAREREVLQWVREGKSAWAIGTILGLSEHTVEFHCVNARKKMGTSTTHAAILQAMAKGLL